MKRAFDISFSLMSLLMLGPLLAAIWMGIWLTSGSPAIFNQWRVGKDGNEFIIKKFRTMDKQSAASCSFSPGRTERVTAFGKILRKTKLDELPQLWNVIKGEMSIVGPRPEVAAWVEAYPDRWKAVLSIRPGITDPASIVYRNEESTLMRLSNPEQSYREMILPRKLSIYEAYVKDHSFSRDLRIIIETGASIIVNNLPRS